MKKLKLFAQRIKTEIWNNDLPEHSFKGFIYKWVRIFFNSITGFMEDKGFDKASTLTFYTLLAIVPLLAIGFGIAQQLGIEEKFTEQVKTQLSSQPQVAEKLIQFGHSALNNTRGGIIATFGLIMLFYTVLRTIGNTETFFDEIWQTKQTRTFWEEIKSYTPIIILFPLFIVGSNSVLIFMSAKVLAGLKSIKILDFFSPLFVYLFHLLSYIISWCLLSFFYIYLPKTKVLWRAGFTAGIITGILFLIWQWVYVTFQAKSASYGAIYGGFAAIPLFLIWLNYSWLILIFGAELAFHIQKEKLKSES